MENKKDKKAGEKNGEPKMLKSDPRNERLEDFSPVPRTFLSEVTDG